MSELIDLGYDECLALLSAQPIGRIAIVEDGRPYIFPVNYCVAARHHGGPVIVIRTRPGDTISRAKSTSAFQVDGIDPVHETGWTVLVQGSLGHMPATTDPLEPVFADPVTWAGADRTEWLILVPDIVTGRRLEHAVQWAFSVEAYL